MNMNDFRKSLEDYKSGYITPHHQWIHQIQDYSRRNNSVNHKLNQYNRIYKQRVNTLPLSESLLVKLGAVIVTAMYVD